MIRGDVDRDSHEPAYFQLVKIFRRRIASGEFRSGSQLPSEAVICREFGVSPMTVRRAVNMLVEQGVVNTIQGKGTFVRRVDLGASNFDLQEFQNLFRDKERTKVQILEARIVTAGKNVARRLSVSPRTQVVYVRRLLLRDGDPLVYHQVYLVYDPRRPIIEAQMDVTSLGGLFAQTEETDIKKGLLSLRCSLLSDEEASLLNAESGFPSFCLEHTFYDFTDIPLSFGWFTCPGDRLHFSTKVGIWDGENPQT